MRVRLFSLFLLLILVISGCALDYNNYPYSEQPQAVPVSTSVEQPVSVVNEDAAVTETEENGTETDGVIAPVTEPASEPAEAPVVEPQTVTFDVSASQFSFTPDTLTVRKGDTIVINLSTVDVPHGFAVTDFGFSLSATTPGQVVSGSFVADTAGTFTFFCNVTCGTGHGSMNGTLVVTE